MQRPVSAHSHACPAGFTLIEILMATALSLMLLGAVIVMFGTISDSIAESRSMLEAADRLRLAQQRLQLDLAGLTVSPNPPVRPEDNAGYLEIIEGPAAETSSIAVNIDNNKKTDTTVGDFDDILIFTTRSVAGRPFSGKCATAANGVATSDVAEVAWFLRGRTLHRRVLLVKPGVTLQSAASFYDQYDISAHTVSNVGVTSFVPNTLGDLTCRENRYAHLTAGSLTWRWTAGTGTYPTLPTLAECSACAFLPTQQSGSVSDLDFWTNVSNHLLAANALASGGTRTTDDVILTNVIGFDVKVWDPDQGKYVDLGHGGSGRFATTGQQSGLQRVYDTWSTSYDAVAGSDGLDNNSDGIIDDDNEKADTPPYPVPLRGIQVKIRTFEPDSKQIREVTVVQDFLPQ
jgi:prepilin-type N-terminal cleavage/methylation domain-containing protein